MKIHKTIFLLKTPKVFFTKPFPEKDPVIAFHSVTIRRLISRVFSVITP